MLCMIRALANRHTDRRETRDFDLEVGTEKSMKASWRVFFITSFWISCVFLYFLWIPAFVSWLDLLRFRQYLGAIHISIVGLIWEMGIVMLVLQGKNENAVQYQNPRTKFCRTLKASLRMSTRLIILPSYCKCPTFHIFFNHSIPCVSLSIIRSTIVDQFVHSTSLWGYEGVINLVPTWTDGQVPSHSSAFTALLSSSPCDICDCINRTNWNFDNVKDWKLNTCYFHLHHPIAYLGKPHSDHRPKLGNSDSSGRSVASWCWGNLHGIFMKPFPFKPYPVISRLCIWIVVGHFRVGESTSAFSGCVMQGSCFWSPNDQEIPCSNPTGILSHYPASIPSLPNVAFKRPKSKTTAY